MTGWVNERCRVFISVALLCVLVPGVGVAQPVAIGDWQRVRNLETGAGISVETKAGERFQGVLVGVAGDSVSLDSDERGRPGRVMRRRDIARSDVREVRVLRRGASILAGAAIGAGVGAGLGAAIDLSARSKEDQGLATAAFTVLGAVLGALIGRHAVIVKGEKIYVSP